MKPQQTEANTIDSNSMAPNAIDSKKFSQSVLTWFKKYGRKDLPWQQDINPYRVWVSEIMLQQTQVTTVIPYYQRFLQRFPDLQALATASIDSVLHLWSGLGYYARARNLHQCAQLLVNDYAGEFPPDVETLCTLPGIGRSTAGAICSIAFKQVAVILDGNVKRVLARYLALDGWPGKTAVHKALWEQAHGFTPTRQTNHYNQAMMDLGATVCTRSKPACTQCPLQWGCQAFAQGKPTDYPGKKPKKTLPVKEVQMLMIQSKDHQLLLEHRPPQGIWGGLWSFPEISMDTDAQRWCEEKWQLGVKQCTTWQTYRHTFSHYHLDITPVLVNINQLHHQQILKNKMMESQRWLWYNLQQPPTVGTAAPVSKLLTRLPAPCKASKTVRKKQIAD